MSQGIRRFGQRDVAAEVAAAVSPARSILASASRKRPRAKPRVFHSVHGEIGRRELLSRCGAGGGRSLMHRRSRGTAESIWAKNAHGADREASQSRTVESAKVKSACGRHAMTSHLNAW